MIFPVDPAVSEAHSNVPGVQLRHRSSLRGDYRACDDLNHERIPTPRPTFAWLLEDYSVIAIIYQSLAAASAGERADALTASTTDAFSARWLRFIGKGLELARDHFVGQGLGDPKQRACSLQILLASLWGLELHSALTWFSGVSFNAMEPSKPIAITFPASSEAIDADPGTKRGPPRVVPNETKLAITDCASRSFAMFKTFGAVQHFWSPLGFIVVFAELSSFAIARNEPAPLLSNASILRRSGRSAQSDQGKAGHLIGSRNHTKV
jgi:hypothetical protein